MKELLANRLDECRTAVEGALEELYPHLGESCAYSLSAGGKRVRPFLVLESCRALGGDPSLAMNSACAVEMIHTYSLIHDDLPAMDNDDLRRGKPSLHRVVGVKKALASGDRLLAEAFRLLFLSPLPPERVRVMASRLASASGADNLVGGQFMDMYPPPEAGSDWVKRMILGKTSAMIRVSMELGVLAAGTDPTKLAPVSSAGDDIGWLFQLTDDILDVTGTAGELGKAVSKDAGMGKWNPVAELGLSGARELAISTARRILDGLSGLEGDWSVIMELVEYLPERRK